MEEAFSLMAEIIRLNSSGAHLKDAIQEAYKHKVASKEGQAQKVNYILRKNISLFAHTFLNHKAARRAILATCIILKTSKSINK